MVASLPDSSTASFTVSANTGTVRMWEAPQSEIWAQLPAIADSTSTRRRPTPTPRGRRRENRRSSANELTKLSRPQMAWSRPSSTAPRRARRAARTGRRSASGHLTHQLTWAWSGRAVDAVTYSVKLWFGGSMVPWGPCAWRGPAAWCARARRARKDDEHRFWLVALGARFCSCSCTFGVFAVCQPVWSVAALRGDGFRRVPASLLGPGRYAARRGITPCAS